MKKYLLLSLVLIAVLLAPFDASGQATPEEIMTKVKAAAEYLSAKGGSGLKSFNDRKGPWVFKDTYVFVFDCVKMVIAAHVNPDLIGYTLNDLVDKHGNYLGLELCQVAKNPKGGWLEYWWPKAGAEESEQKITYIITVPGQPYSVCAGIYEPEWTAEELNKLIE